MTCQYLLCCELLFESIFSQLIIIKDEALGNSVNAFYSHQAVTYFGSIISLGIYAITTFFALFTRINRVYLLLSIYDPVKNLLKKIYRYQQWKDICQSLSDQLETPTDEEINDHDICIICRMNLTKETAKKLPCGHIFHLECMIIWFGSRQICPLCNFDVHRYFEQKKKEAQRRQARQARRQQEEYYRNLLDEDEREERHQHRHHRRIRRRVRRGNEERGMPDAERENENNHFSYHDLNSDDENQINDPRFRTVITINDGDNVVMRHNKLIVEHDNDDDHNNEVQSFSYNDFDLDD